jgi:hypothetical protein
MDERMMKENIVKILATQSFLPEIIWSARFDP